MVIVKLDTGRVMKTCVIEIQYDSVVDLLNAYALNREYADEPSVELITPFVWFDLKIVSTKFNT